MSADDSIDSISASISCWTQTARLMKGARFSHRLNQWDPASCPYSKRSACRFQRFVRRLSMIIYSSSGRLSRETLKDDTCPESLSTHPLFSRFFSILLTAGWLTPKYRAISVCVG